jgi:general secretion pathway protein L
MFGTMTTRKQFATCCRNAWPTFWGWWSSTLLDLCPPALKRWIADDTDAVIVLDTSAASVFSTRNELLQKRLFADIHAHQLKHRDVTSSAKVILPSQSVLLTRFMLPAGARPKLDQIVAHEVARHSPYRADEVLYDYVDYLCADQLEVELAITTRDVIDHARNIALRLGYLPSAIGVEGDSGRLEFVFSAGGEKRRRSFGVASTMCALSLMFLLGVCSFLAYQRQERRAEIAEALDPARVEATEVLRVKANVEKLASALSSVVRWRQEPSTAKILIELTRLLPEDTWIFELNLSGNELRISGLSSQAPALVEKLSGGSLFDSPRFLSPITTQNGKDRFDLALTVKDRRGKEAE